ncbi:MAG: hypothetical protein DMF86_15265 [Acidobacteria bacterium]|nr:MAG: hypothetical protein DMF86_15265 [Acidobacteriota bacterium]
MLQPAKTFYFSRSWLTASDSAKGCVAWGGPPRDPAIDGSVVPCAPGGSLMFTPDISVQPQRSQSQQRAIPIIFLCYLCYLGGEILCYLDSVVVDGALRLCLSNHAIR